jgi:23S rRNA maturation-related 3'-5' exoribonuclease YhaM
MGIPTWACEEYGGYEHDWLDCPTCISRYEEEQKQELEETEALSYLKMTTRVLRHSLRQICDVMLNDPLFVNGFGSAGQHHAYPGGLPVHVAEVVRYAIGMLREFPEANEEVVITAAILHDWMKIKEYDPSVPGTGKYSDGKPKLLGYTEYSRMVRHVAGSHAEFVRFSDRFTEEDLPSELKMKIQHCMLSHHGRKEWGSPLEPLIVEAYIVHFADMLSCHCGPGSKTPLLVGEPKN